ncbi:hypothetical protein P262_04900 [Cronobacter malonaticus]|uniref:Uncharacterized protein n=1 Tax=Cronobacter malonaticus TaxID=413503 RepID=V5U3Y4_9ENTR|nr:hypothetical protein P262_04900 [Cronobacter malonaticus]AKE93232.1 hypothetical protein CSK29544_00267 [Cronobacter sakazakii]CCJ95768.1 hypothetical protein BN131_3441 [Cronobacter malonaticus 681]CCK00935.1 hypothetical protein BN129_4129 [Cronobacter sakazakii 701]CCK10546.1 hypothetical protein BN126_691 [Cronobacter sakazakii 680]
MILCRKKSPHCSGAGFFQFFLYASARPVTCGNGGGSNNGSQADANHGCCVLCTFLFSVLYLYWLK